MALTRFNTAGQIITQVAIELGLGKPADPYGATDANLVQLQAMLITVGKDLCLRHEWSQLKVEWSFTTALGDTGVYPLPADFLDMVEQTGWDRTRRLPLGGPLSSQEWQFLKAWAQGISITALFRINQNELWLYPQPPPVGFKIAMEYKSSAWVIPVGTNPTASNWNSVGVNGLDAPTQTGDVCLFDPFLMERYLKLYWQGDRGYDTTKSEQDFFEAYDRVVSRNSAAPKLNVGGPRFGLSKIQDRMIDGQNLPITGYGNAGGS